MTSASSASGISSLVRFKIVNGMESGMRALHKLSLLVLVCGMALGSGWAQAPICPPRPNPGNPVLNPPDLYSQNGVLTVNLTLQNQLDQYGFMHYCYVYVQPGGRTIEAPTLRLNPGDQLVLNLTNNIQAPYGFESRHAPMVMENMHHAGSVHGTGGSDDDCNGGTIVPSSTNLHFHGLNVPPICHQDDVLDTIIPSGTPAFQYSIQIPLNEPPGLYWYHPHAHGYTAQQVRGGAAGALIIEGNQPLAQNLPERVLILRQQFKNSPARDPDANSQLTLNFQPAIYPDGGPAPIIHVPAGQAEYWRFLNATTLSFASLQVLFADTPQPLQVLAIDGVQLQTPITETTVYVPPAGRAEFVVPGVPAGQVATFVNNGYNTGPIGDPNPYQLLANITPDGQGGAQHPVPHPIKPPTEPQRFAGLATQIPTATRDLYFSEQAVATGAPVQFFITVQGQVPKVFNINDPPNIVTNTGAVEDWTIENRSGEVHAFHIHQIHFLVESISGVPLQNPYMADTVIVPNWSGSGPYPNVKVRMDFRDPNIAGTFVYHCHILDHEDGGMMGKIQVNSTN